ncbi:hypothetical protein AA313_de0204928 [Arthrobotrys entomopaga]|nr:hypothetical protein AA313_de0204928 [Arthrobotrys entomopaga]
MSDTGSPSQNATTTPADPESSGDPSAPSSTTTPLPSSTDTPPPPPITTTTPSTTSLPPPESTTTTPPPPPPPPPPTTSSTTTTTPFIPSSSSEEPPPEPSSTSPPPVTIVTVTPTSTPGDTTITVTTTSLNTDQPSPSNPIESSPNSSSSSSSSSPSATILPSTSGGGLSNPAKIAIAIIIPIFVVVLLAFLGIFLWRRYKKRKDSEEMRRKEVEEYGYNPNNDVSGAAGGAMMGASSAASHGEDMTETSAGYRGWGNTAGGRKASAPMSAGVPSNATGPSYTSYQDGATNGRQYMAAPPPAQNELYGSPVGGAAVPAAAGLAALGVAHSDDDPKRNQDRHSHSPLLSSPTQRPSTADSSTIGAAGPTGPSELDDGLHRGDSVASSRYTNATRHSEGSDVPEATGNNAYMNYTVDGNDYYNDVANPYGGDYDHQEHGTEQGYQQQSPPMIQQVGARRNTRIENPSDHHYAQMSRQGNSGIAQNF